MLSMGQSANFGDGENLEEEILKSFSDSIVDFEPDFTADIGRN
jgi:hypothetical protein